MADPASNDDLSAGFLATQAERATYWQPGQQELRAVAQADERTKLATEGDAQLAEAGTVYQERDPGTGDMYDIRMLPDGTRILLGKHGERRRGSGIILNGPAGPEGSNGAATGRTRQGGAEGLLNASGSEPSQTADGGPMPSGGQMPANADLSAVDTSGGAGVTGPAAATMPPAGGANPATGKTLGQVWDAVSSGSVEFASQVPRGAMLGLAEMSNVLRLPQATQWTLDQVGLYPYYRDAVQWLSAHSGLDRYAAMQPTGMGGDLGEAVGRFTAVALPASRVAQLAGVTYGAGRAMLAGAAADFGAFPADDPNMAELANQFQFDNATAESVRKAFVEAWGNDEKDAEFIKRIKNVSTGMLTGAAVDGMAMLYRSMRLIRHDPQMKAALYKLFYDGRRQQGAAAATGMATDTTMLDGQVKEAVGALAFLTDAAEKGALPAATVGALTALPASAAAAAQGEVLSDAPEVDPYEEFHGQQVASLGDKIVARIAARLAKKTATVAAKSLTELVDVAAIRKIDQAIAAGESREAQKATGAVLGELAGIDFNFRRMNTADDYKALMNAVSEKYGAAKRTISHAEVEQAAAEMGDESLVNLLSGRMVDPNLKAKMLAARNLHLALVEETGSYAKELRAKGGGSGEEQLQLRRMVALMALSSAELKGATSEVARTLSAMRITASSSQAMAAQAEDIMQALGGRDVQDRMTVALLDSMSGGAGRATRFAKNAYRATTMDMLLEAWMGGLLSGPATMTVNAVGNTLVLPMVASERYIASAIRAGTRLFSDVEGVSLREANAYLAGQVTAVPDAFRAFFSAMLTGNPSDIATKLGYSDLQRGGGEAITAANVANLPLVRGARNAVRALPGGQTLDPLLAKTANAMIGNTIDVMGEYYFRLPFRVLQSQDEFFKVISYSAELRARATRLVNEEGLSGQAAVERYHQVVSDPQMFAPDIHMKAVEMMRENTFSQRPSDIAAGLIKVRDTMPGAKVVVPFVTVIDNILRFTFDRTPLKYWDVHRGTESRIAKLAAMTPAERDLEIAKQVTGGLLMATGAMMVTGLPGSEEPPAIRATGTSPMDRKNRAASAMIGRDANSIFVPWTQIDPDNKLKGILHDGKDASYNINRLDPVTTYITMSAQVAQMLTYAKDDAERDTIVGAAIDAFKDSLQDKSYVQGLATFFAAIDANAPSADTALDAPARYVAGLGKSMVPRWIATWNRNYDDGLRRDVRPTNPYETPGGRFLSQLANNILSEIPGYSSSLPAQVNVFGEPIHVRAGVGLDIMSPVAVTPLEIEGGTQALKAAGLPASVYNRPTFEGIAMGIDLTTDQVRKFIGAAGIKGELERLAMPISLPDRVWKGIKLSPAEFNYYMTVSGPELKQALDDLIKSEAYVEAPEGKGIDGTKEALLQYTQRRVYQMTDNRLMADPQWQQVVKAYALRQYVAKTGRLPLDNTDLGGGISGGDVVAPGQGGAQATPDSAVQSFLSGKSAKQ